RSDHDRHVPGGHHSLRREQRRSRRRDHGRLLRDRARDHARPAAASARGERDRVTSQADTATGLRRRREPRANAAAVGRIGPSPLRKALSYAVLLALAVVFVAPILYMLIGSLKPSGEVLAGISGFKPSHLSFDNYTGVVGRFDSDATGHFYDFYLTSLIVSSVVVIGGLVVNSLAAYALARLRWPGRNLVLAA